ncbi:gamma-aminobutyric acid receptor-associated protein-like 2 isoform X1 [Notamacropus eugenii]|uniref:gamma-aminobutyric acid receptor-associated protein-like 2 isoform X1 n=1 Tax=Notamacropus eugenii TaxID=9315 RepID=UPI003B672186
MKWMFKEDHSLEHRCVESAKIRAKYPDRVPVIVEKVSGSQIVDIDKRKYLVPSDITVAQFMWIIRKRIQLPSEKAIFLFVDKTVPQSSSLHDPLWISEPVDISTPAHSPQPYEISSKKNMEKKGVKNPTC